MAKDHLTKLLLLPNKQPCTVVWLHSTIMGHSQIRSKAD